jgi:multidrug efflux pump subunit AcrB
MQKVWIFFLKQKSFTWMLISCLTIVGIYCTIIIPKESAPEVIIPIGVVTTTLRGGSAEDVEKLITNKLEQDVANVDNIDKVTSSSNDGISVVTAQFLASADVDKSIQDLKDAVDKAKLDLPTDADDPQVLKIDFADQPILIVSVSTDATGKALTSLSDDLKKELKKVKGVSSVDVTGVRKREVDVVISKDKLAKYGLSIGQVIAAVQGANASAPIGNITMSDVNYPIKFEGSLDEANQVPDITITSNNGVPVYLRDVAFVSDGLESPKTYSRISVGGKPSQNSMTLLIHKKSGGDVTQITKAVNAKIEELKGGMLKGADVVVSIDNGDRVQKDLKELTRTGLETVVLVMLMLFLTIGWRESIVAGLSIPLSFVIAFIGIYYSGNTINFLSLFSLILAIGILVDSGIVVAEAIHTRMKIYGSVEEAAIASIKEYSRPLIAGTMTTVAAFVPLFFLTGIVGQFVKSIPFTLVFVLIASIFVALGMVPIIATLLIKKEAGPEKSESEKGWYEKFTEYQEEYFHKAQDWYKRFLGGILLNRKWQNKFLIILLVLLFVGSPVLFVSGALKSELFPQDNLDFAIISIEKPAGTPLSETDLPTREVEEILYNEKFVKSFVTTVGGASSLTARAGDVGGSNTKLANITVILGDKKLRDITSSDAVNILRKDLAVITDAKITVGQGNNGPSSGAPVVIKFTGDDLDDLTTIANVSASMLETIPGTQDVTTSVKDDGTQLEIYVDRAKAAQNGFTAAQIAQVLRASVSGVTATTIKKQDQDIDILVKVDLNDNYVNPEDTIKTNLDSIKNLPITTVTGQTVLLGSMLDTNVAPSRASITHEGQKRISTVSSNLKTGANAVEITNAFQKLAKENKLMETYGQGITVTYGGDTEDIQNTFRDMIIALIALLFLMLAILVLEFNSFRYSLYLLMAIPLSLIGVFGGLALSRQSLSFSAMLGIIALAGVIINHAIILLDSILHRLNEQKKLKEEGKQSENLFEVIIESSAIRLRPIVLTTITTVVGMIPLAGVSALWGPLAFTIMFGLMFSMLLTLVLIPMFFYRFPGKKYLGMR